MKKIGVFGSSFNPPTLGHQDVILQAAAHFDEILLIPSVAHAFQKQMIELPHRLNMLRLLIESKHYLVPVKIFNIEVSIQNRAGLNKPVYTFDMMSELVNFYETLCQSVELHFILGPDNAKPEVWQTFYRSKEIEQQWPLFVAKEQLPVHSTAVRQLIQSETDANKLAEQLTPLVGEHIAQYIVRHQLYKPTVPKAA
ncbi:MAG: adenylyltransferase/cytidyltransferase family protein [Gammaproteobacteria bacterium]